jgi:excisionase family DNA binding protein
MAVGALVRSGRIIPEPCAKCGTVEGVQAHHPFGYEGPNGIKVEWLCQTDHLAAHGRKKSERAAEMGAMTLKEAAALLNCTPDNLRGAIRRGAMKAQKLGRDWIVTEHEVERYRSENRRAS